MHGEWGCCLGDLSGEIYSFCCISGSSCLKCAKPGLAEGLWDASAADKGCGAAER